MSKGFANFLVRLLSNKGKDLFIVKLGSALLLANLGVVGVAASFLGPLIRGFIGLLYEDGTFLIDLAIDSYREGKKLKEFEAIAGPLYEQAMRGKKTEAEKQALRKQYLEVISKIGAVGRGPQ